MFGLLPLDASAHGQNIDQLIVYVHILMLVLFVGWGAFYIFVLMRFRQSKSPKADYEGVKSHASSYLEVTVALIEVVLLIGFSIPIYSKYVGTKPVDSEALHIRVIGQQFNWNFHYAGADGKFGKTDPKLIDAAFNPMGLDKNDPNAQDDIFTISEMHVPADKPIIVSITSRDVIHSFGVPNLRVKQDAVPGLEIPVWFEAKIPGRYDIACSQLCGDLHYSMIGFVNVDSPEKYQEWIASQTPAVMDML
jgi:cytochrome c oxidase subunit 2